MQKAEQSLLSLWEEAGLAVWVRKQAGLQRVLRILRKKHLDKVKRVKWEKLFLTKKTLIFFLK